MESSRNLRVDVVVLLTGLGAAFAEALALREASMPAAQALAVAAMLTLLVGACRLAPLHIGYKRKMLTDSAPLFAGALLLQPWLAGLVGLVGMGAAESLGRGASYRNARQACFNSSQRMLSAIVGSALFRLVAGGTLSEPELATGLGALFAVAAMFAVGDVLLLVVVTAQLGRGVFRDWLTDRSDVPYDIALYASGFVCAFAASAHVWLLPLLVFPVVVFHRAMRDRVTLRMQTRDAVESLADVVDMRDPYTFEHSRRVADYSRAICARLGLSQDLTEEIVAAARVHDVGKIGVRDAVLLKAGRLSEAEYNEIKQHPDIGARLTGRFPDFFRGTAYIRHHHERWDGAGYPLGLAGAHIPLGARVIAAADTYDAITSTRVYRAALGEDVARKELERAAGSQLDPRVVEALFAWKEWVLQRESASPPHLSLEPSHA